MFYYISVSLYFYLKKKIKKLKYQRIVQSLASYFIYLCLCFYFREFKKLKLPKNRVIAKENSVLRFISLHLCFYYIYVFALYFSATPLLFSFRFFFFLLSIVSNNKYLYIAVRFKYFVEGKSFPSVQSMRDIFEAYLNWRGVQFAVSTLDKSSRVNINV